MLWGYADLRGGRCAVHQRPLRHAHDGRVPRTVRPVGAPERRVADRIDGDRATVLPPGAAGRLSGLADATGAAAAAVGTIGIGLLVDRIDVIGLFNTQATVSFACAACTYVFVIRPSTGTHDRPARPDSSSTPIRESP